LDRVTSEVQKRFCSAVVEARRMTSPIVYSDVVADALTFPVTLSDQKEAERRILDNAQTYFEETWIHRPLRSLNLIPPVDAAGHGVLRKKLLGVLQFLHECAAGGALHAYDFDRLRRKLGLLDGQAAATTAAPGAALDIGSLGAAELAGLKTDALSYEQLQQAFQAANKLSANDLAAHFARSLVTGPVNASQPDRFVYHAFLTQKALNEGNTDEALNSLNEGEKDDCEHNEGRRRNDYELRRGQIHAKRREVSEAQDVFERLVGRAPDNLSYRGSAVESMLSLKQGAAALRFAEGGLAEARKQNNRDSEQYFLELVAAAKKQI